MTLGEMMVHRVRESEEARPLRVVQGYFAQEVFQLITEVEHVGRCLSCDHSTVKLIVSSLCVRPGDDRAISLQRTFLLRICASLRISVRNTSESSYVVQTTYSKVPHSIHLPGSSRQLYQIWECLRISLTANCGKIL